MEVYLHKIEHNIHRIPKMILNGDDVSNSNFKNIL